MPFIMSIARNRAASSSGQERPPQSGLRFGTIISSNMRRIARSFSRQYFSLASQLLHHDIAPFDQSQSDLVDKCVDYLFHAVLRIAMPLSNFSD